MNRHILFLGAAGLAASSVAPAALAQQWSGYAGNDQHTALSATASQNLDTIHWSTPVDLNPQYSGNDLLIHYGSPSITAGDTVIVPVKTGASGGFELKAFNGATGALKWTESTNYTLPPSGGPAGWDWTPSYSPTLTPNSNRLYFAGTGGSINYISSLDTTPSGTTTYFVGGTSNTGISINTPLTSDSNGNIYFGFQNSSSSGPSSGPCVDAITGAITTLAASSLPPVLTKNLSSQTLTQIVTNSAPAVAPDGSVYVAMNDGNYYNNTNTLGVGRLVKVNFNTSTSSLAVTNSVVLTDPKSNTPALLLNDGTASPMIGPNGDVYMGVYDVAGTSRGWMEHYNSALTATDTAGGFGWDDTASIVPASMVHSYTGSSPYLIMTKYNNYADARTGGDGNNMIAILDPDPNDTQTDTRPNSFGAGGATIMKQVLTISGPTPDPEFDQNFPDAVREWCINTAVVDPATDSILVNSEDGTLYRWDLATNTFTQSIQLTDGLGEAYTPTIIGPDGTVYAISNATLFAIGEIPEPARRITPARRLHTRDALPPPP